MEISLKAHAPSYEELAVQSLDAAIEIDRLQRGETINRAVIDSLADNLGLRRDINTGDALSRLVDPRTVDIYNRTVFHLTKIHANTVDELAAQIRKYADSFKRGVTAIAGDDLSSLREFCIALHRELLSETYDRRIDSSAERV